MLRTARRSLARGFTLVELMVVMVIIAILASMISVAVVKVIDTEPQSAPLTLESDAGRVLLGREVAAYVQVCDPAEVGWLNRRAV